MKRTVLISTALLVALVFQACNSTTKPEGENLKVEEGTFVESDYLGVADIFLNGKEMAGQDIQVKGIVEHVCKHTWKRFKIVDAEESGFIKVELGEDFSSVDATLLGHTAYVYGKLVPVQMDATAVEAWEKKTRENHKGEEDTAHFKEEIAMILEIHQQIVDGEIPYHMSYTVEATTYEIR